MIKRYTFHYLKSDMIGESPSSETQKLTFLEPHSLAIRVWHWAFFLVLSSSLVTVLFGSTLFRTRDNIGTVQQPLQEKGIQVNKDQAQAVAHEFSDKLWDLHKWIGFIICALLVSRILIEIAQPSQEKLKTKIKKALNSHLDRKENNHYIQVKWGYLLFYLLIFVMAVTGLGLAFEDVPLLRRWHETITQVHSVVQYFIYGFILIHLVGVIRADGRKYKGLVSGMIHGKVIR
jgi:Ni/Fe-hydrogenase 1 B-type cytochrome subunit